MPSPFELNVGLPGSDTNQPKFNYSSPVQAPGEIKSYAKKSKTGDFLDLVTTAGEGLIKGTDTVFKMLIDDEATDAVDRTRDEWGVQAAALAENDLGTDEPRLPNQEVFDRAMDQARFLHEGYKQGTIKDSNYWARLDSISRQLRARYPGYREHIDAKMSSLTGRLPANALRDALADEARAAARTEEDPLMSELKKKGHLVSGVWPTFFQDWSSGKTTPEQRATLLDRVNADEFREWSLKKDRDLMAHSKESVEHVNQGTFRIAQREAMDYSNKAYLVAKNSGGLDIERLQKEGEVLSKGGLASADPQRLKKYMQDLQLLRSRMQPEFEMFLDRQDENNPGYSYRSILNDDQQKELENQFFFSIAGLEDLLSNGSTGFLKLNENYNKAVVEGNTARINALTRFPGLVKAAENAGIRHITDNLIENPEYQDEVFMLANSAILNDLVQGRVPNIQKSMTEQAYGLNMTPEQSAVAIDQTVTMLGNVLETPDVDILLTERTVKTLFGVENRDFLNSVDAESRARVFNRLTSAKIAKNIKELGETSPVARQLYDNWVNSNFMANMKASFDEVTQNGVNGLVISYDPDIQQLRADPLVPNKEGLFIDPVTNLSYGTDLFVNQAFKGQTLKAVENFNRNVSAMKRYAKDAGLDVETYIGQALKASGTDFNKPPENGRYTNSSDVVNAVSTAFYKTSSWMKSVRDEHVKVFKAISKKVVGESKKTEIVPNASSSKVSEDTTKEMREISKQQDWSTDNEEMFLDLYNKREPEDSGLSFKDWFKKTNKTYELQQFSDEDVNFKPSEALKTVEIISALDPDGEFMNSLREGGRMSSNIEDRRGSGKKLTPDDLAKNYKDWIKRSAKVMRMIDAKYPDMSEEELLKALSKITTESFKKKKAP